MCPFDYTAVAGSGRVGPLNYVNHTSWVIVVTPTEHILSRSAIATCNRTFSWFVLSLWFFDIFVDTCTGAFVMGRSQISPFFFSYIGYRYFSIFVKSFH